LGEGGRKPNMGMYLGKKGSLPGQREGTLRTYWIMNETGKSQEGKKKQTFNVKGKGETWLLWGKGERCGNPRKKRTHHLYGGLAKLQ